MNGQKRENDYKWFEKDALPHGGDLYGAARLSGRREEELLDFSANINPLGVLPEVRQAVLEGFSRVEQYPDPLCRRLTEKLAQREHVSKEQILCGCGGADLIYRFAFYARPKKALLPAPTFAEYEEALTQAGTECVFYELNEEMRADSAFLSALTGDVEAVFLCNPNNPTGLLTQRGLILQLLDQAKAQNAWVFLDECFLDFVEGQESYTLKDRISDYPNLLILKSFTKLYAIPGLRLGYVLSGNRELLQGMRKAGQPWAVGSLAQEAGLAALAADGFAEKTRAYVAAERAYVKERLEGLGLSVYDGQANYLCFRAPGEEHLYEKMLEQGVILRRCANYRGLTAEHYRAAVRNRAENEKLIAALENVRRDK